MAEPKAYTGADVVVRFDGARCRHAGECVRGLPEVFDTRRRPWILPDGAPAERVAEVVRRCPTGALTYELADGSPEPGDVPTRIDVAPGRPLLVRGDVVLRTPEGEVRATRAALCRCGATANPPHCDGSGDCSDWPG